MPESNELLAGLLVFLAFLSLLVVGELWRNLGCPKPEWTRKLVHCTGGLVCAAFPLLFRSHWVVLMLAAGMALIFYLSQRLGLLRCLHGVARPGQGPVYYAVAVYLVFVLAGHRPHIYIACVLVLAVSDGVAGLVGSAYGTIRYRIRGAEKSLQGSLAFLISAFFIIQVVLLCSADARIPPPLHCGLAALLTAVMITGLEAAASRGSDNLVVPLGVLLVLPLSLAMSLPELARQLAAITFLVLIFGLGAWGNHLLRPEAELLKEMAPKFDHLKDD
jgi:dolichol kinase